MNSVHTKILTRSSDQAHCRSDNIPTSGALTFYQPCEGDGDVDAAICVIDARRWAGGQTQLASIM
jgi:hypothetical protein